MKLVSSKEVLQTAMSVDQFQQILRTKALNMDQGSFDKLSDKLIEYINTISMVGVFLDPNPDPITYSVRLSNARNLGTSLSVLQGKLVSIESSLKQYIKLVKLSYETAKSEMFYSDEEVIQAAQVATKKAIVNAKLKDKVNNLGRLECLLETLKNVKELCDSKIESVRGTIFDLKSQLDKMGDYEDNGGTEGIPVEEVIDIENLVIDDDWFNS